MSQQAQNDYYPDVESAAMAYAEAVNAEIKDLFAAGADIVQIDEPYMQARPDAARAYGLAALNRARGVTGTTAVHICFGYAAIIHERPEGYSFLSELAGCPVDQISIETAQSGLDLGVRDLSDKTISSASLTCPTTTWRRRSRWPTGYAEHSAYVTRNARPRRRLRDEVSPARAPRASSEP